MSEKSSHSEFYAMMGFIFYIAALLWFLDAPGASWLIGGLVLLVGGPAAWGLYSASRLWADRSSGRFARTNRSWRRVAHDLALSLRPGRDTDGGGSPSAARLSGNRSQHGLWLEVDLSPNSGDLEMRGEFLPELAVDPAVWIAPAAVADVLDAGRDLLDEPTGDRAFDAAMRCAGPADQVVGWLDPDRREHTARVLATYGGYIHEGRVRLAASGGARAATFETDRVRALNDLAVALAAVPAVTPDRLVDRATRDSATGVRRRALEVLAAHRPLDPAAIRRLEPLVRGPGDAEDAPADVALAAAMLFDRSDTVAAWAHARGAESDAERRDADQRVARAIRWLTNHDPERALRASHDAFARATGEASALASVHAFATIGGESARGGLVRAAFAASDAVGAALLHVTFTHDDPELVREVHTTLARYANSSPALGAIQRCRIDGALDDVAWLRAVAADRHRPREVRDAAERAALALRDAHGHEGLGGALALHSDHAQGGVSVVEGDARAGAATRD